MLEKKSLKSLPLNSKTEERKLVCVLLFYSLEIFLVGHLEKRNQAEIR